MLLLIVSLNVVPFVPLPKTYDVCLSVAVVMLHLCVLMMLILCISFAGSAHRVVAVQCLFVSKYLIPVLRI